MTYCPTCGRALAEGGPCPVCNRVHDPDSAEPDPLIDTLINGRYRIVEPLGAGGMGAVYKAVQEPLGRAVAIKVIEPRSRHVRKQIKRFYREARLQSSLSHPNVATIYDFGNTPEGVMFIVMELLTGQSLTDFVPPDQGLPLRAAAEIFERICAGVGAAHACRIVHRDLNPGNVVVDRLYDGNWSVKVLDFGLSKSGDGSRITATGQIIGTPGYIAPEQIGESASADARADIYALGALLFFLLAGKHVYDGPNQQAIMARQVMDPPTLDALERDMATAAVRPIIVRALDHEPGRRPQTTRDLIRLFHDITGLPEPDRRITVR